MADNEFQELGNQNPPLGTGEGEIPLAQTPAPKIDIRTMASDIKSVEESGGGAPRPYTPPPQTPSLRPEPEKKEEPVFRPSEITPVGAPAQMTQAPLAPPKKSGKGLTWSVIIAVIVIGLAALGYFVIYPILKPAEVIPTPPPPAPPVETPTSTPTSTLEVLPPPEPYVSLFKTSISATTEVTLTGFLSLTDIQSSFGSATSTTSTIKEVVWRDDQEKLLTFEQITSLIVPQILSTTTVQMFNKNFTAFAYGDSRGVWPGYIFELKDGTTLATAEANFKNEFEKTPAETLKNFFAADPGAPQTWKQGKTGTILNRYLVFPELNTSLNYAWVQNKLLISTSYDGFKEALKNL